MFLFLFLFFDVKKSKNLTMIIKNIENFVELFVLFVVLSSVVVEHPHLNYETDSFMRHLISQFESFLLSSYFSF